MDNKEENQKIDIEELKNNLEEAKVKYEEYLNGWKRERADFLNYKKDEIERIGQLAKYANEEIILKIIPILDNIYLAESHIPEELTKGSPTSPTGSSGQTSQAWKVWIEGFTQIKNQLCDFLQREGIEPIEVIGKPFDPVTMEVVEEVSPEIYRCPTPISSESVLEEVRRGYTLYGKIIRPAKVKISK